MGTLDLAKVRFARSPMEELRNSVYVLTGRRGTDLHRPWVSLARARLAGLDLTVLFTLLSDDQRSQNVGSDGTQVGCAASTDPSC